MARVTSDVGSLLLFLNGGSLQLVSDLVLAAGICGPARLAPVAARAGGLVAVPLYAVNHRLFSGPHPRAVARRPRRRWRRLYALLSERVSAVRVVRSFAKEEAELAELDCRIDAHRRLSWAGTKAVAWQGALATLISGLGTVVVARLRGGPGRSRAS